MTTVTNIQELTITIIKEFADMFEVGFSPYNYSFLNDTIHIINHDQVTVLSITKDSVKVKDIIQDTIDNFIYEEKVNHAKQFNDTLLKTFSSLPNIDSVTSEFLYNQVMYVPVPQPNFKTFKYFNSEEEWFQQSTLHEDVLPYETAVQINRIKKSVMNDLMNKWCCSE